MIKVLVVEDSEEYRNGIVSLLDYTEGFCCVGAYRTAELAILQIPNAEAADVAIIDIGLPGMDGIELVKELKKKQPSLLCMMCTGMVEDEKVFNALEAGAYGYILKNNLVSTLLDAVTDLKNGGSPMSSEIARKVMLRFHKKEIPASEKEYHITPKETEVLQHLSQGLLYKEIAAKLGVGIDTIKRHCYNIYEKMHVSNRTEAINKFEGR